MLVVASHVLCVFIKNNIITNGHVDSVVHYLSPACQVRTVLSIASQVQVRWGQCGWTHSADCRNSARGGRCNCEDQACVRKMSAAPRTYCQQLVQEWSGCASPSRMHVRKQAGNVWRTIGMHGQKEGKGKFTPCFFFTTHNNHDTQRQRTTLLRLPISSLRNSFNNSSKTETRLSEFGRVTPISHEIQASHTRLHDMHSPSHLCDLWL